MSDQEPTHAYVARKPCCDSVVYMGVDDNSAELGRDIARLIRDGRRIERVTLEDARNLFGPQFYRCKCEPSEAEKKVIARHKRERSKLTAGFRMRRPK
jgi:hypothetical protein